MRRGKHPASLTRDTCENKQKWRAAELQCAVHCPASAETRSKVALERNTREQSAFKMILLSVAWTDLLPILRLSALEKPTSPINRKNFLCQIQSLPRALSMDNPHFA